MIERVFWYQDYIDKLWQITRNEPLPADDNTRILPYMAQIQEILFSAQVGIQIWQTEPEMPIWIE
jgi:hypothetical protein